MTEGIFKWTTFHITKRVMKKCHLTKPCSTIKVTHIPGFITVETYANVAVGHMGICRKHFTAFGTDAGSKSFDEIKTEMEI